METRDKNMEERIKKLIQDALENLDVEVTEISLEHPADIKMGDYSTNVAMVCAKALKKFPNELAEKIVAEILRLNTDQYIEKIEVAGAGFINFYLSRKFFADRIEEILNQGENVGQNNFLEGKRIMIEYTDPNPFKVFHIGHLNNNTIGESISRIVEWSGAEVKRTCYQGDVGMHVAKAVWGFMKNKDWGTSYVFGSQAYEEDEKAKKEIQEINKKIYLEDEEIMPIYEEGKTLSLEAFEDIYRKLGTKFEFYFLESEVGEFGKKTVLKFLEDGIFEKSDGAIVFHAEKYAKDLHTRVFVNREGLPTYEAKELGLAKIKYDIYKYDKSIIITGNEINEYFKVLLYAMKQIFPELAEKTLHLSHGMLRLSSGKMSSRTGNVITAEELIDEVKERVKGNEAVAIGAIKYSILRSKKGGDVVYNVEESISTVGDSGPYLQYSYARANSVIEKAKKEDILPDPDILITEIFEVEKLLYRFSEVILRSAKEYEPHYIANYLIELARAFNSFYGNTVIVNKEDPTSAYKVALSFAFISVMKKGLYLLGIEAPEKM